MNRPEGSIKADLARLGFGDAERAQRFLAEMSDAVGAPHLFDVAVTLGHVADPDRALLGLVRLVETGSPAAIETTRTPGLGRDRLFALLSGSQALTDHLVRHPEHCLDLAPEADARNVVKDSLDIGAGPLRATLLRAVGADPASPLPVAGQLAPEPALGSLTGVTGQPGGEGTQSDDDGVAAGDVGGLTEAMLGDALRVAYRRELVALAGRDLAAEDAPAVLDQVAARLADLAAAALETALAIARFSAPDHGTAARLAVMGMGKCGGRELNYVSDVDVIYVVEPAEGAQETDALAAGTALAGAIARICSAVTSEGALWPVDANLRPEGKDGPLVRTIDSHRAYYKRWAKTWEFQALLKARHVAGDEEVAQRYLDAITPMVWEASTRENFVEDTQAMRRRVEQHVPAKDADRQIKLGAGGLRDIEFSVQLLQLVHGRADADLRHRSTLHGLAALVAGGYVGRPDAATMDTSYRFLRALEHRIQLDRLRRTHVLPSQAAELRRLGRSLHLENGEELVREWRNTRSVVRTLHEGLFYRPLLAAAAKLSTDDTRLTPEAAQARLAALGYRDPAGAMRHIEALTSGVSRRAAIQRQLLPVLLGWFADGIDPDAGLLAFRTVSESLGSTHWYLKMLRDTGAAAQRMTHVLSSSRYIVDLLQHSTEATRWFGDDDALTPRELAPLRAEVEAVVRRRSPTPEAAFLARHYRGRELLRTAISDVAHLADIEAIGHGITAATTAALHGSLLAAAGMTAVERGYGSGPDDLPIRLAVIAMGSFGGDSMGYASDADVMFVYEPREGGSAGDGAEAEQAHQELAMAVVTLMQTLLREPMQAAPPVDVSTDLRPEGRNGPLVRSFASYAEYYRRWAEVWEAQALLRAVPVSGDPDLGARFAELVDPVRYPANGLTPAQVREIRRIKARVESERLPRGVTPARHLKLGPGGLTDVEWTVQLLQLRHAGADPSLRTTSTLRALRALEAAGHLEADDAAELSAAYRHASSTRNALTLWKSRGGDVLPTDRRDLEATARLLGMPPQSSTALEEEHLRLSRHARAVVDRVFYDE